MLLNRHVIERHVGKSDFELVTRMMSDWKDACSTITDTYSVMEKLDSINLLLFLKKLSGLDTTDGSNGFLQIP